jgi:hypothetical protein
VTWAWRIPPLEYVDPLPEPKGSLFDDFEALRPLWDLTLSSIRERTPEEEGRIRALYEADYGGLAP